MRKRYSGLRICIASSGLGHVDRGIEAWADEMGCALARRGEQVILCKGSGQTKAPYERIVPCLPRTSAATKRLMHYLPKRFFWRVGLGSHYGVEQTSFAVGLIRQLAKEPVDIVHVQDPILAWLMQRAYAAGWVSAQTVLMHGTEEPDDFLSRFHYLLHLAPWHREQAVDAGIWQAGWDVLPNFVDVQRFAPDRAETLRDELSIPRDALVLLVSSAIKRRHKRVDYLLQEVQTLREKRPDLPLWLIVAGGRHDDTEPLQHEAQQRLGDRVRFLIAQPRDRMPEIYRCADVLIHGSLMEMMPIALLEATASGLPCVVHQHPVMQWMVGSGGRAADLEQPGGLVDAVMPLLQDYGMRIDLGRRARIECISRFCRDIVVDQALKYYSSIVPAARRAA